MAYGIAELLGDISVLRGWRTHVQILGQWRDLDAFGSAISRHGERGLGQFEFADVVVRLEIDFYN